jgi:transcriptional regulator
MYLRAAHRETSAKALLDFIRANPLGILTTAIPSTQHPLIQSSHIPWVLDVDSISADDATVKAQLRGHIARANPQAKAIIESYTSGEQLKDDVMVLFTGPAHHYVTPKFYTETKPSTGKVVPTWNYSACQVYGKATVWHDAAATTTSGFLTKQIHDLSQMCEMDVMGYTGKDGSRKPWEVADAPERYVDILRKNIIGIQIEIGSIGGKFKMSQEMGEGDRAGVVAGFKGLDTQVGQEIADLVRERGEMKDAKSVAAKA